MTAISLFSVLTILVVDDEPDSIEVVSEVLEYYGSTIHNASDGRQALALLENVTPDLILSDLSMPNMDGWALLANIRKNPKLKNVPVVALTAHAMPGDMQRAMAAGFTAYLTKPISVTTLITDLIERVPALAQTSAKW